MNILPSGWAKTTLLLAEATSHWHTVSEHWGNGYLPCPCSEGCSWWAALLLPGPFSFCSCTGDPSLCQPGVCPEHYENKHQGERGKKLEQMCPTKWHRASDVSYIVLNFRALPEVFELGIWSRVSHENHREICGQKKVQGWTWTFHVHYGQLVLLVQAYLWFHLAQG